MDSIKTLLRELITCNIIDRCENYSYNDVCLEESSEAFRMRLQGLYESALIDVSFLNAEKKNGLIEVVEKYKVVQSKFDVPNSSHLEAMNHDIASGNDNPSLKKERDFVEMVCECVSIQKHYLNEFAEAIGCVPAESQPMVNIIEPDDVVSPDDNIIKGVKGLAEFLRCGINTAQNIINSEILAKKKIQYRTGKGWRFRKDKLSQLLEVEPEIFKKVGRK